MKGRNDLVISLLDEGADISAVIDSDHNVSKLLHLDAKNVPYNLSTKKYKI